MVNRFHRREPMIVNFEFLGKEPIENVITCMNFKIDKVVFFGYEDDINELKAKTENFLRDYCAVETVIFEASNRNDLKGITDVMQKAIRKELNENNEIFFDLTGGESLTLVAFGMLSKKFPAPRPAYEDRAAHRSL